MKLIKNHTPVDSLNGNAVDSFKASVCGFSCAFASSSLEICRPENHCLKFDPGQFLL